MSGAATHGGVDSCWFGGPAAPRPSSGNNPCWGPAAPPALSPVRSDWPHWTHGTRSPGPRAVSALPPAMETGRRPRLQTLRELWGRGDLWWAGLLRGAGGEPEAGQVATGEAASREQSEPRREVNQAPGDLVQPHWTSKHRVRTRPLWPQPASVGRPSTEAQRTQPLGMTRGPPRWPGPRACQRPGHRGPAFSVRAPVSRLRPREGDRAESRHPTLGDDGPLPTLRCPRTLGCSCSLCGSSPSRRARCSPTPGRGVGPAVTPALPADADLPSIFQCSKGKRLCLALGHLHEHRAL